MFPVTFVGMARAGWTDKNLFLGLLAAILILLLAAQPAVAVSTFVVNRTTNESDAATGDNVCDVDTGTAGNQCTLKAAIQQANATTNEPGVPDKINFNIPGDPKKVKTIKPTSELPALTQAVTIDGYSQPGSKKNTRLTGAINAVQKIQLDGSVAGIDSDGLIIQEASDITIRGLVINNFDRSGIFLTSTDGSDDNKIEGNFIGTSVTGTADRGNDSAGVEINGLNDGNVVGGNLAEQRNLISGNDGDGVFAGTDGDDTIQRNLIGTDKTGLKDLHNGGTNNGEGPNTNDGGTENDADTGPNGLQNFPAITSATTSTSTGETKVDILLDSTPSTQYTIRLYSNPRDTGEGKTFIGEQQVTTNTNGTSSINDFVATRTVPVGQSITATATDPAGNTSEFTGEPRSVRAAP